MNTLVVHIGGIGDFLLACPALARLADQGPLEVLGRLERVELAVLGGLAQAAYDLDSVGFSSLFGIPEPQTRSFLARFDRCILWIRDEGPLIKAVQECGVAEVRAFPGLPPNDWARHASEYYGDCLGLEPVASWRLGVAPAAPAHDVIIHPGSGGRGKNWPLERFIAVSEALASRGRTVTWCRGPAEEGLPVPGNIRILPRMRLALLARELAAARCYLGNDSGITHLAAAAGCPTWVLFGPTAPQVWAPRGPNVTMIAGCPQWPETGLVLESLEQGLMAKIR